ncbi:class I SAM-dependent methyltransferase [Nocardioides nematodiphilus]|uniref:class I SAM-dependent methyltransferase n=1 Tax=Nocardioides nematodiphilus TaxID=2849669 RepID=UPI001CD984AA|nr:class I SAM-dependent methyltransferase [Nocardioides nematodiphilus]MCA1983098.1 class I SAM-dependent methyltransferase [Nocardioides nematodiphilus]
MTASPSRPAATGGVAVDDRGVLVTAQGTGPLVLSLDDRYLWSITPERDGAALDGGWLVAWPHVLERYLNGTARISVADVTGETVYFDADVTLGSGEGHIEVVDGDGYPLSVDKVGHLGRSFAATDEGIRNEILEGTQRVLRDLKEKCGVEAYLNYGALLGTIRDGAMIAHDSDTDVCYLSRHESPADLIAESYKIERTMRANGWILLRMSGGDIKVLLPLSDGRNCHIDIFVAFYVRGTFYQLGNRNGHLPREVITPLSEVELHGYRFPAPAQPERMLAFLYGPQWRVPDPSFKYNDPAPGVRRLNGWLRGFRTTMGLWTEFWSGSRGAKVARRSSSFRKWVSPQLAPGSAIVDVGCGNGRDAVRFAKRGHRVWAVDFSRGALHAAGRRINRHHVSVRTEQLILGELRQSLTFGARLARDPHHIYARRLLNAIDDAAREQFWQLCSMGLRGGEHALFVEFSATLDDADDAEGIALDPDGREHRVDPVVVVAEMKDRGGVIEHFEIGPGVDLFDRPDPAVCRIRATWPSPKGKSA